MRVPVAIFVCVACASPALAQEEEPAPKGEAAPAPVPEARISFLEALSVARDELPDLPAAEVRLLPEDDPPRYRVTYLSSEGTEAVDVHATTGEVLDRSHARIEVVQGRFAPGLADVIDESEASLADVVPLALRWFDEGDLREVSFQVYRGRLVAEILVESGGVRIGTVIDPTTGRPIVR